MPLLPEADEVWSVALLASSSSSEDKNGPRRRLLAALCGRGAALVLVLLTLRRLAGLGEAWNAGVFSFSACVAACKNAVSSNSSP